MSDEVLKKVLSFSTAVMRAVEGNMRSLDRIAASVVGVAKSTKDSFEYAAGLEKRIEALEKESAERKALN